MLSAYYTDTATITRNTLDEWSQKTGVDESVSCRVDWKERVVINQRGESVVSMASVLLPADTVIDYDDTITIDGSVRRVISKTKLKDFAERALKVFVS